MQEVLEAELEEALGASKGERTPERLGCCSGYYGCTLVTRVGKLELRVPQNRQDVSPRSCSALPAVGVRAGGDAFGDVCARGVD
ncbi:transposase [Mesorhizobium sp. M0664]|uniref:transposase n=1 Tax=Mesorhizobium sp. M0664 TaxID=2956982 RepID=UPI00333782E7